MKQIGEYIITQSNIAKGSFACIHKGKHIYSNLEVAIKEISLKTTNENIKKCIRREIDIHRSLDHPNIVKLYDVYTVESSLYLIIEFCSYGDLQKFQNKKSFSEKYIQYYMKQLRDAMQYLQSKNIMHRDLKPQNILLISPIHIKITDFGLARIARKNENNLDNDLTEDLFTTYCGSPIYMSPELLNHEGYNTKSDLWSLGVILYELITGTPPYIASNLKQLVRKVNNEKIDLTRIDSKLISSNCLDLLTKLLNPDKDSRLHWNYFFHHKWFDKIIILEDENYLIENPLDYNILQHHNTTETKNINTYYSNIACCILTGNSGNEEDNLVKLESSRDSHGNLKFSNHLKISKHNTTDIINKNNKSDSISSGNIKTEFTFNLKSSQFQSKLEHKLDYNGNPNNINLSDLIQDDIIPNISSITKNTSSDPIMITIPTNKRYDTKINKLDDSSSNSSSLSSNTPNSLSKNKLDYKPSSSLSNKYNRIAKEKTNIHNNNESPTGLLSALKFLKETYEYLSSDNKSL